MNLAMGAHMKLEGSSFEKLANGKPGMTPKEIIAAMGADGHELSDDELDEIAGGFWNDETSAKCPYCKSTNISPQGMHSYKCLDCKRVFTLK